MLCWSHGHFKWLEHFTFLCNLLNVGALWELSDCREFRVNLTCWNTTSFHRSERGGLVGFGAAVLAWEMTGGAGSRSICLSPRAGIYWMNKDIGWHLIATLEKWRCKCARAWAHLQRWHFRLDSRVMMSVKVDIVICWTVGLHFTRLLFSHGLLAAHWHTDYYANSLKCLSVVWHCWSINSFNLPASTTFPSLWICTMSQEKKLFWCGGSPPWVPCALYFSAVLGGSVWVPSNPVKLQKNQQMNKDMK